MGKREADISTWLGVQGLCPWELLLDNKSKHSALTWDGIMRRVTRGREEFPALNYPHLAVTFAHTRRCPLFLVCFFSFFFFCLFGWKMALKIEVPWGSFYARPFLGLVSLTSMLVRKYLSVGNYFSVKVIPWIMPPRGDHQWSSAVFLVAYIKLTSRALSLL